METGAVNEVEIRQMLPGDSAPVAELAVQLGYSRTAVEVAVWVETLDVAGSQAAFVAVMDGEIVGWIEASTERRLQSAPCALIGGLVVRDGVRGARIGQRLCQRVERWAAERGLERVRVTSRITREDAHRFYLRDGYVLEKTSLVFAKRL